MRFKEGLEISKCAFDEKDERHKLCLFLLRSLKDQKQIDNKDDKKNAKK